LIATVVTLDQITEHADDETDARVAATRDDVVSLSEVTKTYETPDGGHTALRGVSFTVARGEFLGIHGKSGAGKSTLLNMITGVDHLTEGEVWVNGASVHSLDENQLALWRGLNVGVVYQSFELMPQLSLIDNVVLPMDLCGLYEPRTSVDRARMLLDQVGLADHAQKRPSQISGGQKQRVAIARALANEPPLIVADEPTGNLDSKTADAILALFDMLIADGTTIIMVTHERALLERTSRAIELVDGVLSNSDQD